MNQKQLYIQIMISIIFVPLPNGTGTLIYNQNPPLDNLPKSILILISALCNLILRTQRPKINYNNLFTPERLRKRLIATTSI